MQPFSSDRSPGTGSSRKRPGRTIPHPTSEVRPMATATNAKPDEEGDHDGQTLATRSREVVEDWARRRGAEPAAATFGDDGRPRVLRFDFEGGPDRGGSELKRVSWDD